jgi:hypothetical protein
MKPTLCCKMAELVREQSSEIAAAVASGDVNRIYNLGGYHQAQRTAFQAELQEYWSSQLGQAFRQANAARIQGGDN